MEQALEYRTELMSRDKVEHYWPQISAELDKVPHIWQTWFTKEYLYAAPWNGDMNVWGVGPDDQVRMVVYTRVSIFPASRILQILLALGNDLERCLPSLEATIESFAQRTECDFCEIYGREGWIKKLKGFRKTAVVLTKKINKFTVQ